ncbi:type VII secretion integral membrane protein EccD [Mycolicibacterium hassiacum]|uniref:type VII secretion integral membrane protein EccD n=1 Tax=Mycolicibacterium hassiacum TaxID=46351 RepID=UPI000363730F|nr:type VII secretion integral membrane protein EccD [Mycolicibacterium hassiacum]MBX5487679.1 type VII secretion integral membrane protein EccD [Mycolicibacterium hassiacum]
MTVHYCGADRSAEVDVTLPTGTTVGELIPQLVDLVCPQAAEPGARWRLSRLGDPPLDDATTPADNDLADGELLLLCTEEIPPAHVEFDAPRRLARTLPATATPRWLSAACATTLGVFAAAVQLRAESGAGFPVAAGLALTVAVAAVLTRRTPRAGLPLSVIAVGLAAAAGYLAPHSGSVVAQALSAAAVAFAVAVALHRFLGGAVLGAVACAAGLTTAGLAAGASWALESPAIGAAIAVAALALLTASARIALALAGVGPALPTAEDTSAPDPGPESSAYTVAHTLLTGVVTGCVAAAVLGVVLVASGRSLPGIGLAAVVAAALLLRARTHAHAARRTALVAGGVCAAIAALAGIAVAAPSSTVGIAAAVTAVAAGVLVSGGPTGFEPGPRLHRVADIGEYLALAAVVPLACWVAGVYRLFQGAL